MLYSVPYYFGMDGIQTLFPVRCSIGAALMRISGSVLDLVLFRVISNPLHADILVIVCIPCYGFRLGLFCNLTQKICGYLSSFAANISKSTILDWRTYYGLWWFLIIFFRSDFLVYALFRACSIPYTGGIKLCFLMASFFAGMGDFATNAPRVLSLASSPAPARACLTYRSNMRVSAEDTESSVLHVHAGYPNY
jgi:hypothetical protein